MQQCRIRSAGHAERDRALNLREMDTLDFASLVAHSERPLNPHDPAVSRFIRNAAKTFVRLQQALWAFDGEYLNTPRRTRYHVM